MKIQIDRLKKELTALADIGRDENGCGISRLAYSQAFSDANSFIKNLMKNAGMTVHEDGVKNVIGIYKGKSDRIILIGSHIDTVKHGGMFDGCLGVISAIEVVKTFAENGFIPEHTIMVCSWAEEEGIETTGLVGSASFVGLFGEQPAEIAEKLASYGIDKNSIRSSEFDKIDNIEYSLELHIEQGGVLDENNIDIGIVNGIVGIERYNACIYGRTNHAGSTPMSMRDDALVKAAKLIIGLDTLTRETDPEMVYTSGFISASPGSYNVIPGKVDLGIEFRAVDTDSIDAVRNHCIKSFSDGELELENTFSRAPSIMSEVCKNAIRESADALNLSFCEMNSGAGHDTMILARAIPDCGMIFVPSKGGISHSPEEWTEWKDCENGANVLLESVLRLDVLCKA